MRHGALHEIKRRITCSCLFTFWVLLLHEYHPFCSNGLSPRRRVDWAAAKNTKYMHHSVYTLVKERERTYGSLKRWIHRKYVWLVDFLFETCGYSVHGLNFHFGITLTTVRDFMKPHHVSRCMEITYSLFSGKYLLSVYVPDKITKNTVFHIFY